MTKQQMILKVHNKLTFIGFTDKRYELEITTYKTRLPNGKLERSYTAQIILPVGHSLYENINQDWIDWVNIHGVSVHEIKYESGKSDFVLYISSYDGMGYYMTKD